MKSILVGVAMAIAVTGVAAAQDAPDEPKPEKKICRTEKMTGSLTRRTRLCLTEAQWRELNSRTQRGVQEMQNSAGGGTNPAQNPAQSQEALSGT
jgi:opacity protein-like surface antigen